MVAEAAEAAEAAEIAEIAEGVRVGEKALVVLRYGDVIRAEADASW